MTFTQNMNTCSQGCNDLLNFNNLFLFNHLDSSTMVYATVPPT